MRCNVLQLPYVTLLDPGIQRYGKKPVASPTTISQTPTGSGRVFLFAHPILSCHHDRAGKNHALDVQGPRLAHQRGTSLLQSAGVTVIRN